MEQDTRPLARKELIDKLATWKYRKPEIVVFIGSTELVSGHEALVIKQEKRAKEHNAGFSRK